MSLVKQMFASIFQDVKDFSKYVEKQGADCEAW